MSSENGTLLKAIKNNDLNAILNLAGDISVNFCKNYKTPLLYALKHNASKETVVHLIRIGADVNYQDDTKTTPLMYAMQCSSRTEIIKTLIKSGANVDACDKWKRTPIMYTTCYRCKNNICYNKENVQTLLNSGANAKHTDSGGNTILHLEICSYLINLFVNYGLSLESKDKGGDTPLITHVLRINKTKVKTLLSIGANPNCRDRDLNSPLFNACDLEIINMLLYYGADTNIKNIHGKSPLISLFEKHWTISALTILKHILLYKENELELSNDDEKLLSDHWIQNKMKECRLEIDKMKIHYITINITFYDFCMLKKTKLSKFVNISKKHYLYSNNEIQELFSNYYSIIIMKIKSNEIAKNKNDMVKKLEKVNIMPQAVEKDIPGLNYDCLCYIGCASTRLMKV